MEPAPQHDPDGFPARLQARIDVVTGGNVLAFARISGCSEGTLRKYLKGASQPQLDLLVRLAEACRTTVAWLATGDSATESGLPPSGAGGAVPDLVTIPLYDIELSAGPGREPAQYGEYVTPLHVARALLQDVLRVRSAADVIAMQVAGDSMAPTIVDGAMVLLDRRSTRIDRDGMVYAMRYDDVLVVKRAHLLPGVGIRLRGDNPAAETVTLPIEEADRLQVIGRVCGVLNRL